MHCLCDPSVSELAVCGLIITSGLPTIRPEPDLGLPHFAAKLEDRGRKTIPLAALFPFSPRVFQDSIREERS